MSLFTNLFFFWVFLVFIKCYLSNNKKEKKNNLSFLCIMAYVKDFLKDMFCVFFLILCRKKWACCLLKNDLICFCFILEKAVFSIVTCLERSQSQCILSGSCKRNVMFVWQHFGNLSLDAGILRRSWEKCRLSYFYNWLYLCILYQWNFLYWRLNNTTKMLFWPLGKRPWLGVFTIF